MAKQRASKKRAKAYSTALFLIGLAIVTFTNNWWPGIMLAVGLPLALRQFLMGRTYDTIVSLVIFGGVFITVQYAISWQILLPILFTLGGIYIFFREFIESKETSEVEKEEDINQEIEENKKK